MQLEINLELPSEPVYLKADPLRLTQVFGNLVNNACKYTGESGRIDIVARREGSDLVVSVKDTGVGIPADMLPMIFEMFTQVDQTLGRSQGGLGIGLSLVKELVELHGGSVAAHSAGVDRGSEFIVRLPATAPAAPGDYVTPPAIATPAAKPARVLVVDDNADGAESLASLLRVAGHETAVAFDGEEAMRVAREFDPELAVLDIGLPQLDGYEVARRIRRMQLARQPLLIALTGWGQEEDREKSRQAGFNHHLVKPVTLNALLDLLAEWRAATT
jgi:CheY-like chemotaxis protein